MKTVIEVGVCDFDFRQPDDDTRVIYCEPIPWYMDSLKQKVTHYNAIFEQRAISDFTGTLKFKSVYNPSQEWVRGISHVESGASNLITLNQTQGYNLGEVKEIEVQCTTLNNIIRKYNITEIDILKIDVEGHEVQVMEGYDWSVLPKLVMIEHKFIEKQYVLDTLGDLGYTCMSDSEDVFAKL